MSNNDFEIWKASPHNFYRQHRGLFQSIIGKNSFVCHRNGAEKAAWENALMLRMNSPEVVSRLKAFSAGSTFLVFFLAILRDVAIAANQAEDTVLLRDDFNTLIVKYQPMAEIVVCKLFSYQHLADFSRNDVVQQLLTNLLGKREVIRSSYDEKRLFRNFIWKIAENEAKNIIKAENKHNRAGMAIDSHPGKVPGLSNQSINNLAIDEVVGFLHCKMLAYLHLRFKLLLCLKTIFDHKIFRDDFKMLVGVDGMAMENELEEIIVSLNNMEKSESGKLQRFELVRPLLNLTDKSTTDASSYWRWTNYEINKIIQFLNSRLMTDFDRETFGYLLDSYFQYFPTQIQFGNHRL